MKTGLDEIEMLVQVAAAQSISRAARSAKVPTSTFSRAIARLEERLGTPLLRRMSRGELLTPAGRRLVEESREHVRALRSLADGFAREDGEPHGRLRLTAPMDFGRLVLGGVLGELARKYPRLQIEADYTLRVVDLIGENYDCAVRVSSGSFARSALVAHRIASFHILMCASPEYLASRPPLRRSADLREHTVIGIFGGPGRSIVMQSAGKRIKLPPTSNLMMNDPLAIREAAVAGGGIGTLPGYLVRDELASGKLVQVLPQFRGVGATVYFVHTPMQPLPPQIKLLRELITPRIRELLTA